MDIPNSEIVIPIAIVAGCFLIVLVTWRLTRSRSRGWHPEELEDDGTIEEILLDIDALDTWHRDHGAAVLAWIDSHERTLESLSRSGLQLDLTAESPAVNCDIDAAMREAITAHPTPAMRAQLSAMTVAAEATIVAVRRSQYASAEKQHLTYIEYRNQWRRRLRQGGPAQAPTAQEVVPPEAGRVLRSVPDVGSAGPPDAPTGTNGYAEAEQDLTDVESWEISRPRRARRRGRSAG